MSECAIDRASERASANNRTGTLLIVFNFIIIPIWHCVLRYIIFTADRLVDTAV